jgi:putative Holliday junction resolvase
VGSVRVGVARSDPDGMMAVPVETLARADALRHLVALVQEYDAMEVFVGLPRSLAGRDTSSTADAEGFAGELASLVACEVRMIDERLSTVQASADLRQAGRSNRNQRQVVDQAAAVILLQHALDSERIQGVPPGLLIKNPVENND